MVPHKDGGANEGHSCVKGRFAFGYATHPDRVLRPMVREKITDPWREVEWDEAIGTVARRMLEIRQRHGAGAIGAITSSRCTNEEVYVVQKMVRAAFGSNNVDTCAGCATRPRAMGSSRPSVSRRARRTFGRCAQADVIMVIGANPTDGHPVFASRMKQRLRQGAKLIVVDPRRIDLVRSPHIEADHHLQLKPRHERGGRQCHGARRGDRGPRRRVVRRGEVRGIRRVGGVHLARREQPGGSASRSPACRPPSCAPPPACTRRLRTVPSTTAWGDRTQPGLDDGDGHGEPGDGVRQYRPRRRRREPAARPEQRAGLLRHGVVPARAAAAIGTCRTTRCVHVFENLWGTALLPEPGLRIPNMFDAAIEGTFRGLFVHGEDIAQSDPNVQHVTGRTERDGTGGGPGPVPQRDREVRPRVPARRVVPGEGRHLHQRRTPDQPGPCGDEAEERSARVGHRLPDRHGDGLPHALRPSESDHGRDRRGHTDVRGVSFEKLDAGRQHPVAVRRRDAPDGTPIMHVGVVHRGARAGSCRRRSCRPTSAARVASR